MAISSILTFYETITVNSIEILIRNYCFRARNLSDAFLRIIPRMLRHTILIFLNGKNERIQMRLARVVLPVVMGVNKRSNICSPAGEIFSEIHQAFGIRHADIVIGMIGHGRAPSPAAFKPLAGNACLHIQVAQFPENRCQVPHGFEDVPSRTFPARKGGSCRNAHG